MRLFAVTVASMLSLAVPASAGAQSPAPAKNLLNIQPIGAILGVWALEYERALNPEVTFGLGATYWEGLDSSDNFEAASGEVKVRYYPEARPFDGLSFGMSAGIARTEEEVCDFTLFNVCRQQSRSGPSIGVILDYNWLLGHSQKFYVGVGLGAKRVFVDDTDSTLDFPTAYPTARLSVGFAF